ncbi:MAG: metal-dependent transcriptional regulator [Candidatus Pacebacteria bacterium]|nr:metal-dependent transcriptional regulator [Candidatus Paceibacterota bacterium]
MTQELSATLEDYLTAVYRLECEKRVARPRDIAREQKVAKSTVTAALKSLAAKELINYEPYEAVTLTPEGVEQVRPLIMRHRILVDFLRDILGLEASQATDVACGMEHAIAEDALERIVCFLAFTRQSGSEGEHLLDEFRQFLRTCGEGKICRECIEKYWEETPKP